jgi:Tfp pilus assembly protein PilX
MSMTTRNRLANDEGWVLMTAIILMGVMLSVGLALLSVVDTQSNASGKQRKGDSAFNYAEGALNSTAFLLSRSWPDDQTLTPNGTTTACGDATQTLSGTIGGVAATSLAGRIQNQLTSSFSTSGSSDYSPGTTSWKVNICDDTGATTSWNENLIAAAATTPAWDSNGELTVTATDPTIGTYTYKVRRVWVRAQATVAGRTRTVVGLVQVNVKPALPSRYAALVGGFSADLMTGANSLLTGPALSPLTTKILGQHMLYQGDTSVAGGGKLGIRCGLTSGCVTGGAFATLSSTNLSTLLLANDFVQYPSQTAVADATMDEFRRQAKLKGYYHASVASGSACIPAADTNTAGKIVFVETVGTGDEYCTISSSAAAKMLVVANGRVQITGGATSATTTRFTGVIYAGFNQRDLTPAPSNDKVVMMTGYSQVVGAIYVDGTGKLDVRPPALSVTALINTLPVCQNPLTAVVCKATLNALPIDSLLTQLISLAGLNAVVDGLYNQLAGYGPAVQESKSAVDAITTYGSTGTVAGTFRQVQPND